MRVGPKKALAAGCLLIMWPGAFIFAFPGVMGPHWQEVMGVGRAAIGQSLFFVLMAAGSSMYPVGRLAARVPIPRLALAGVLICGTSVLLVSWATAIWQIYLWAFVMGISASCIYIPGLLVVQQWFPRRRGLVSGLFNLFFGLSAAIMSPIFNLVLSQAGYWHATFWLGGLALLVGLTAAPLMRPPGQPAPTKAAVAAPPPAAGQAPADDAGDLTAGQAVRTTAFWGLWLTWALAGAGGIAMVTLSTSFGLERGLARSEAVLILAAFNLTNGFSRIISGYLSDVMSRNLIMCLSFAAAGVAYPLMGLADGLAAWAVLASLVGFSFGTLFAVSAPLATDCFGLKHFGAILGLVFTAYGYAAGALGPWLSGYVLDRTNGDFQLVFNYLGAFLLASAGLIMLVRPCRRFKASA